MAHLTNFSLEFFYNIFTEDASLPLLYHGAKKSKMTKNSNQGGGPALRRDTAKKKLVCRRENGTKIRKRRREFDKGQNCLVC